MYDKLQNMSTLELAKIFEEIKLFRSKGIVERGSKLRSLEREYNSSLPTGLKGNNLEEVEHAVLFEIAERFLGRGRIPMNYYEKFRALLSIAASGHYVWEDFEAAGITKELYRDLELKHLKEVEEGTQKEDLEAFMIYKREFLEMLHKNK